MNLQNRKRNSKKIGRQR